MNPYLILWSILNHVTIFIITADIYRFWFYHRLLLITGMSWGRRIIYNFVTKLLSIRKNLRIVRDVLEKGWKNRSIPRGFIRRGCFIKYSSMLCGSFFQIFGKRGHPAQPVPYLGGLASQHVVRRVMSRKRSSVKRNLDV